MICNKSDKNSIELAIKYLQEGKVLILPTDTVYGFSSLVDHEEINTKELIQKIKGRGEEKPFIQLIASPLDFQKYSDQKIPDDLLKYWPGPLTIIAEDKRLKNEKINTTAFRCPGDKWLRDILKELKNPIYSTSVNRSGLPVLCKQDDIIEEFNEEADLIILDGDSKSNVPSTIVKLEKDSFVLIRKGVIDL